MVERKRIAVDGGWAINVVTEQMSDGLWAVVTSVTHTTPSGEQVTDLPVSNEHYASQAEAEGAGAAQARDWLERNMPRAA